jgi:hypothetical protein
VLTLPENMGDLYNLPRGVITTIKSHLQADFPVRIDSESHVSLFAYDNGSLILQSFRPDETTVNVSLAGEGVSLRNLITGASLPALPAPVANEAGRGQRPKPPARTEFAVRVQPHSYVVLGAEKP